MVERLRKDWIILLFCLALSFFYFWRVDQVPFHPDESTHIYMSQDFFTFFKNPLTLSYSPGNDLSKEMTYRAIDAPLTRYLVGFARMLTNSPGLFSDWDWSQSWSNNLASGAYPPNSLLVIARAIPVVLLSTALYFFYLTVRTILPKIPSVISLVYLGLNPLVLLHGRRAMAEPILLFGVILVLWAITRDQVNPMLVGVSLAVAFNAKQTGAFLIPAGIIAVCTSSDDKLRLKNMLARSLVLIAVFVVLTYGLNPFYWKSPLAALSVNFQARSQLLNLQLSDYLQGNAPRFLTSLASLITNLFISPPAIAEITKYLEPMRQQIDNYNSFLPNIWGRNLLSGAVIITLVVSGFFVLFKRFFRQTDLIRRKLILLFLATISMAVGILIALPIPWQRYVVPLLPLAAIWLGYAFLPISEAIGGLDHQNP